MKIRLSLLPLFISLVFLMSSCYEPPQDQQSASMKEAEVWVGTYTRKEGHVDGKAAGIYRLQFEKDSLLSQQTTEGIVNPSFLCLSPTANRIYAVSEIGPDVDTTGYVYSYQQEGDQLVFLNRQPTFSFAPCHVSIHPKGEWLYVANYVGGMIVRYPVAKNGKIEVASDTLRLEGQGPNERQDSSHPHSVTVSPDGYWVMVADLGTDKVHTFSAEGALWELITTVELPGGSGPRHFAFHPRAPYAYVLNELNSTITAFHYNAENGALNIIDHWSTLPDDFSDFSLGADLHFSPDGEFLYASNRGDDSLAGFQVDTRDGSLEPVGYFPTRGAFPRNFAIHPDGKALLVANQNSDNVVQFSIDPKNGKLRYEQEWEVKTPVCLQFVNK